MIQITDIKIGDVIVNERFHTQYTVKQRYTNSLAVTKIEGHNVVISGDTFDVYSLFDDYKEKYPEYLL